MSWTNNRSLKETQIKIPSLFVAAKKDTVLRPELAAEMPSLMPNLTWKEVEASHWALIENPKAVNAVLKDWFETVVLRHHSRL